MTTIHVSKNDPSAFSTLQEAILSIDDRHDEAIRIEVAPGIYEEKLFIRKENIEIVVVEENPSASAVQYYKFYAVPVPLPQHLVCNHVLL